jgi:hypothetical protein
MPLTVSLEIPAHRGDLPHTGFGLELFVAVALLLFVCGALALRLAK